MSKLSLSIAFFFLLVGVSKADESPFAKLIAERAAKRAKMVVDYREAKDTDRDGIYAVWKKADQDMAEQLFKLALVHADRAEAFEFLVTMVIQNSPDSSKAVDALAKHHVAKPHAGKATSLRFLAGTKDGWELVRLMETKNPDRVCQAAAAFALGEAAKNRSDFDQATDALGRALKLASKGQDEASKSIARETRGHLAGLANRERLKIGQVAPDLQGLDTEGKKISLTDYRGKVVLVDFWSFWCDSCVQLIPHQKELVARYDGKPFAIFGVNGDAEYNDEFQRNMTKFKVTWRSLRNDAGDDQAKWSDAWNVQGWPTLYLIDAKGVIRKHWKGGPKDDAELDREIEKALADMGK